MKHICITFLFTLMTSIVPSVFAGNGANFKLYYDLGVQRFHEANYEQAANNFEAASYCDDAQPEGKIMMERAKYCLAHLDTAEIYYGKELYIKAFYHYSVVAQNNSYDTNCRKKMSVCYKKSNRFDADMSLITYGKFWMGSNKGAFNEQPSHSVLLDSYYITTHEITNEQYVSFLNMTTGGVVSADGHLRIDISNPDCKIKITTGDIEDEGGWFFVEPGYESYPVVCVSWYGANDYAKFFNMTLPTEAQFEFAYADQKYHNTTTLDKAVSGDYNKYGLYNMGGNVWEWCQDWYSDTFYQYSPEKNPLGADGENECKVTRGGSFTSNPSKSYKTYRDYNLPSDCKSNIGFRCVKNCPGYHPNTATY